MQSFVLIQTTATAAEELSAAIWEQPGILGIEELPADGGTFPIAGHDFVRFDARPEYEAWVRTEAFRTGDLLLKVYLADGVTLPAQVTVSGSGVVEPRDYLAAMRAQHHGRVIGQFWVGPPWETQPAGPVPVIIEPGMAFGLGDHPTTQMCLELLAAGPAPRRVLDFGAGSGILAIAVGKLFPDAELWLTDLDPQCRSNVEHNFALNGLPVPAHQRYGARALPAGPFDLVLSNVYLEALKSLAPRINAGCWIVSGLLGAEQLTEFQSVAEKRFVCRQVLHRDDNERWFAVELCRRQKTKTICATTKTAKVAAQK